MLLLPVAPQAVSAQETSSTPVAELSTPFAAVQREFEIGGMTFLGPIVLASVVIVYETPEDAIAEFPRMHEYFRDAIEGDDGENLKPASTPKIGDERKAYAGPFDMNGQEAQAGIFAWREGSRVYILFAGGLAGDMLTPLFDLASSLSGRTLPDTDPVRATSPDEMNSGGAYELLPTLDDMPPGWVFSEDTDMLAETDAATPEP